MGLGVVCKELYFVRQELDSARQELYFVTRELHFVRQELCSARGELYFVRRVFYFVRQVLSSEQRFFGSLGGKSCPNEVGINPF